MRDRQSSFGPRVLVRGAGDFASGIIHRLHSAGFRVAATELEKPRAVRRGVAFSEAVYESSYTVEGVTAVLSEPGGVDAILDEGGVPVVIDPDGALLERRFDIVVDARSAKKNLGTTINDAAIVVAIGPGFDAGVDCHAVVETLPGKGLGRVVYKGPPAADTGHPSPLEMDLPPALAHGFGDVTALVLRAPTDGTFTLLKDIASEVAAGETIGWIRGDDGEKHPLTAAAGGIVRGLVRDGTAVEKGMKLGDIDPTMDREHCFTISDKARSIAGGVLEACITLLTAGGMIASLTPGPN
jgi:xanthine dehydrogenase accessory factor